MEFAAFQSVCIIMLMFAFSCAFSVSKDCAHEFDMTYRKMLDIEIDRIERRFEAKLSEIQIRMQNGENRLTKEIRTLKKQLHNERLNNWKNTARFGQKLADIKYHILVEKRENYSKPDIKWITIKDIETVPVKGYMTYNTTLNGVTCKGRNTDRAHKIDRNRLIQGEIAKTIPLKPDEEYETTLEDDNAKKPLSRFGIRRQIATATGSRVAFFARLSTPSPKLTSNQAIVFDDIVTNLGGGYNTYNGSFVPPVPGIYVVTTSVLVDKNHSIVSIVKNGQALSSMVVDDDPNTKLHESHSTQTAIVQLEKSDRVSVQNHGSGIIFYGGYFSTFSGFLLYENDYNVDVIG